MAEKAKRLNIKNTTKNNFVTIAIMLVIFAVVQILVSTGGIGSLYKGLLVPICIYIILAVSLNLVVGFLGELSLGHAGFMCVGAYVSGVFSVATSQTISNDFVRFLIALVLGGLAAAVFGIIIGIPVLRLRGDYLAIVTLAFGEIIKNIVNVLYVGIDKNGLQFSFIDSTGIDLDPQSGKMILKGAQGIMTGSSKGNENFLIAFVLVLITVLVIMALVDSRTGRAITAIRDNRIAAESIGISVTKYKLLAFVISAFFAGIAGVIYTFNFAIVKVETNKFDYNMSILILVFVVLGGMGSIRGSVIATIILYTLPEVLRQINSDISNYRMLIYAIILVVMMIVNNNPKIKDFTSRFSPRKIKERYNDEHQKEVA